MTKIDWTKLKGKTIVLDGMDKIGKTTVIDRLIKMATDAGFKAREVKFDFPTDGIENDAFLAEAFHNVKFVSEEDSECITLVDGGLVNACVTLVENKKVTPDEVRYIFESSFVDNPFLGVSAYIMIVANVEGVQTFDESSATCIKGCFGTFLKPFYALLGETIATSVESTNYAPAAPIIRTIFNAQLYEDMVSWVIEKHKTNDKFVDNKCLAKTFGCNRNISDYAYVVRVKDVTESYNKVLMAINKHTR